MHSKSRNILIIALSFILIIHIVKEVRNRDSHVTYYIPEFELYVRLSPSFLYDGWSQILVFSKELDRLPKKNSEVLTCGLDNIWLDKKDVYCGIYIKKGEVDTIFCRGGSPHSGSIPMEEVLYPVYSYPPEQQQKYLDALGFYTTEGEHLFPVTHTLNSFSGD